MKIAPEKRIIALMLIVSFGVFGAHRFYVGKKRSALALIGLFFCGILSPIIPLTLGITMTQEVSLALPFIRISNLPLPLAIMFIPFIFIIIWLFIDTILILFGKFTNNKGEKLVKWL